MPTVEENHRLWTEYPWPKRGEEWSVGAGGTPYVWHGTIMPRIARFVPCGHILEIAPGFGRLTEHLAPLCRRLTIVDLVDKCIQACRRRFAHYTHIEYHVNDGKSLAMVPDDSVDFVFSWDSLVHVEQDVIDAYLSQLATKLKPGGVGLISHSNIGVYVDPASGRLTVDHPGLRGRSVTADTFRAACQRAGLWCVSQEPRTHRGPILADCISLFCRPGPGVTPRPTVVYENHEFFRETHNLRRIAEMYRLEDPVAPPSPPPGPDAPPIVNPLAGPG